MVKLPVLVCAFALISGVCHSQYSIKINIDGLKSARGNMMIQLFDENKKVVYQEIYPLQINKCTIRFSEIKPGKYAVRYYHDENMNGKLDTNILGKPVEGYGFSNNAVGKFGPPPFEKWLFEVDSDKEMNLTPAY
jgi:uncharacterized protein (DUF2141 family)